MRILLYSSTWIIMFAASFGLWAPLAEAHPLGNFTINQYSGLQVSRKSVGVDYVMDMAEIPAFQAINRMDANHNHKPDQTEISGYPKAKCNEVTSNLSINVDQQPLALSVKHSTIEFPPGVGGLSTLRLTCALEGEVPLVRNHQIIEFENKLYPERLGWQEITVAANNVSVQGDYNADSITKRLTDYPTDLLSSPFNQRRLSLEVNPSQVQSLQVDQVSPKSPGSWGSALLDRGNNAFTRLVTQENLTFPTILIALITAFVWGGFHALAPGHGKTIVGSYLIGSRGNIQHALFLGLTVTITHTAGIFALGLVMLSTSKFVLTEQLYPWLSLLSGLLVTVIGLNLFLRRLKVSQTFQDWIPKNWAFKHEYDYCPPQSSDTPHQSFSAHLKPSPNLAEGLQSTAPLILHGRVDRGEDSIRAKCLSTESHSHRPIALLPDSIHNHSHEHHHSSHEHHSHHHGHNHSPHSHLPPDDAPIKWSSLLALGISGGLVPCPSALVVLLSAIAIGRTGFGLLLVSAFSLGLAGVLTGIGLLLIYAKKRFERLPLHLPGSSLFPSVSALCITLLGLGITIHAIPISVL